MRTGSARRAEVAARRRAAAVWTLAATAATVGVAFGGLAASRPGVAVLAGCILVLVLLPAVRAQSILRRRSRHFQPFQLLLLAVAAIVQASAAVADLAGGTAVWGAALAVWALVTVAATVGVQRTQLHT